jgi:hypothetical protein
MFSNQNLVEYSLERQRSALQSIAHQTGGLIVRAFPDPAKEESNMTSLKTLRVTSVLAAGLMADAMPASADVVSDWNAIAEAIQIDKQLASPPSARVMSMMHVAIFEAVNAIDPRYHSYGLKLGLDPKAHKEAAAAAAAHSVLMSVYPEQSQRLNSALSASLATIQVDEAQSRGLALGKEASASVLRLRVNDGSSVAEAYRPFTSPGVYVPTATPVFSNWGSSTPFIMTHGSQFRPEPPPALNSSTWADDSNEVRRMGGLNSSARSVEQTNIGRFWLFTGPQTWNPILRQVAGSKNLSVIESARLFALVNMAGNDAYVAVMDAKYAFNFWRPVTAIRNADLSKNPLTAREPDWQPLGPTPLHPEYPCAHCIASTAAGTVIKTILGDEVAVIRMTSPTAPGVTRMWSRVQDYIDEVSVARIYAGFHYRFSTKVGEDMGRKIADLTLATQLGEAAPIASAQTSPGTPVRQVTP